jgi:hypothetical protein
MAASVSTLDAPAYWLFAAAAAVISGEICAIEGLGRLGLDVSEGKKAFWNAFRPNMGIGGITPAQKLKMAA